MKTELFRKVLFWGRGVVLKYCGPFCPEKGQKGPQQGPFSWLALNAKGTIGGTISMARLLCPLGQKKIAPRTESGEADDFDAPRHGKSKATGQSRHCFATPSWREGSGHKYLVLRSQTDS